jgi:hypothetical protein
MTACRELEDRLLPAADESLDWSREMTGEATYHSVSVAGVVIDENGAPWLFSDETMDTGSRQAAFSSAKSR